jgi:hypothetical protein
MRRYPGNHTDSELLSVPRFLKTRPGAPQTHLAYITDSEADLLQENKPGTPHGGPHGIPNYDSFAFDREGNVTESMSGSEASGRENPQDRSQQRQDYSHSTRDVRSSANDREKFRIKTGQVQYVDDKRIEAEHYIETPAEKMAVLMANLTKNSKYMNMPILVPKGVSHEDQLALLELGKNDPQKFIDTVTKFEDISAGNPNLDFQQGFGTGYDDWYKLPPLQGGDGGGGGGAWGSDGGGGGGYGGGGGGYAPEERPQFPGQAGERWGAQNPLQQAMINIHGGQGFQQGFRRGGIVSLVA